MATLDILTNDLPGNFPLDPTSVVLSNIDASLTVTDNNDGTVEVTGTEIGIFSFDYTVDDTEGTTSNVATVSVSIRATGVLPGTIANLVQHLDAGTITGLADTDTVATWTADVGSNGIATGTPTYVASGLNGLPAVKYTGSNNSATARTDFTDPIGVAAPAVTVAVVYSEMTYGAGQDVMIAQNTDTGNRLEMRLDNGNSNVTDFTEGASLYNITPQWPTGFGILAFRINATTYDVYRNQTIVGTGASNGTDIVAADWRLGAGFDGNTGTLAEISEVVIYDAFLNNTEMANLIKGFQDKYGLS